MKEDGYKIIHPVWSHLYEFQGETRLTHGDGNQNRGWKLTWMICEKILWLDGRQAEKFALASKIKYTYIKDFYWHRNKQANQ